MKKSTTPTPTIIYFILTLFLLALCLGRIGASYKSTSQVRIITIDNQANWPFYHTALELSYSGFNQTYGFFSTMSKPMYWFLGWIPHLGQVIVPDIFFTGSAGKTIPSGLIREPIITLTLNATQTQLLEAQLEKMLENPGLYSYINHIGADNCASWVTNLLNPILEGAYLDCSVASWLPLKIPSGCRLVSN